MPYYLRAQENNTSLIPLVAPAAFTTTYYLTYYLTHLPTRGSRSLPSIVLADRTAIPASYHQLRRPPLVAYSPSYHFTHLPFLIPSVAPAAFSHLLTSYHFTHLPILPGSLFLHRHIPAGSDSNTLASYLQLRCCLTTTYSDFHHLQHLPTRGSTYLDPCYLRARETNTNIIPSVAPAPPTTYPLLIHLFLSTRQRQTSPSGP